MEIYSKGIANLSGKDEILDIYFPYIKFEQKVINNNIPELKHNSQKLLEINWSKKDLDRDIESVSDAYLKLHLLSNKLVLPNTLNLEGLFTQNAKCSLDESRCHFIG